MKIKLLIDYIGRETAMKQRFAGDELDMDHTPALELIAVGIAEAVEEYEPRVMVNKLRRKKEVKDDEIE